MTTHLTPIKENDHSSDKQGMSESSKSKIDPSFKSKRYRDKLRTEIKGLEGLLPVDRTALSRKLDSQTVFRLVIAYFRSKIFFKASGAQQKNNDKLEEGDVDTMSPTDDGLREALDQINISQLLDGFLLTVTSDGTVLYVSDGILQYLGFNQVDLMHRCLYGIIHPDDHPEVKSVFEHTLGHIQVHTAGDNNETETDTKGDNSDTYKAVSFLCRMKCFNGTTAGYLKMHCSGKICHLSELSKMNRTSCQVLFLFCHPFMINTTEIDQETKQNVFWSKHDLDLSIRELDKKALSILGYHSPEVEGRSFYSLIHPEDVATCASCHKTLTESNDVQTLYFRIQSKDGGWVWVQSRGKVICKNSKKFSIVFSHCPVREEDSTYIQQESIQRQRYAINDLMCLTTFNNCGGLWKDRSNCVAMEASVKRLCSPSLSTSQDDSYLAVHNITSSPCPSSWHALSDRHSPILPSSHVAHKISQREKQAQFQEFKRRQAQQDQPMFVGEPWEDHLYQRRAEMWGYSYSSEADWSRWNVPDYSVRHGPEMERLQVPQEDIYTRYPYHSPFACPSYVLNHGWQQGLFTSEPPNVHNMPPSPPPSPHPLPLQPPPRQQLQYPSQRVTSVDQMQLHQAGGEQMIVPFMNYSVEPNFYQTGDVPTPTIQDLQKTAEKYLSYCEYDHINMPFRQIPGQGREEQKLRKVRTATTIDNSTGCRSATHLPRVNHSLKMNEPTSQSCAYAARCHAQSAERNQSVIQTEGHMMIVEHGQPVPQRGYMDLPSIGSFLEYLNEV